MAEKKKAAKKAAKKAPKKTVKGGAKAAKASKKETKKADKKVVVKSAAKVPKVKAAPVIAKSKKKIIQAFAIHEKDTGSAQVQVAILTNRIDALQSHLKDHPKDNHSRKGLLAMVGKRRKHLDYLKDRHPVEYEKLIKDLGLRK